MSGKIKKRDDSDETISLASINIDKWR